MRQNLSRYNSLATSTEINRILNIHQADRPGFFGEFDIFTEYEINNMTSAAYYFESHNVQFYRILFFFRELRLLGMSTDEQDVDGTLPTNLVPRRIQEIIYDDNSYSRYLLEERFILEMVVGDVRNVVRQNLAVTARPYEEDMVLLFSPASTSGIARGTSTTTTTTSTTTLPSTTIIPDKDAKSGRIRLNQCGRYDESKKARLLFPERCCTYDNTQSYMMDPHRPTNSCLQRQYNYSVTNSEEDITLVCSMLRLQKKPRQKQTIAFHGRFPADESSILLKMLNDQTLNYLSDSKSVYKLGY